jgi:mono/diheme cytochrome c family protein
MANFDPIRTAILGGIVWLAAAGLPEANAQTGSATAGVIDRYCLACHNDQSRTAGLSLASRDLDGVGSDAEVWEKVVRKLRSGSMPPIGAPRPPEADYERVASFLEGELDRAAAANPYPGPLPLLRRLTRTEYRNAIRDLLALEALPQEMDYELLLPADNATSGFDNIAELLFVSPATMERYLEAARKISRLAIGDMAAPEMVNIHRMSPEHSQEERDPALPPGTRGGLQVPGYFPLDADYVVDVELAGRARDPHQLEVTVDGTRAALVAIGGRGAGEATVFRLPLEAGPHRIGVTFLERNEALAEATLRPRMRSRGTQPAIASMTIRGPYDAVGPGNTPARERVFICTPEERAEDLECARDILSSLVRNAYRRPATEADLADLLPFYAEGRETSFDLGIQKALERLLVSPQFLFRIERERPGPDGAAYPLSDLELATRLSFFLWSSLPDAELLDRAEAGELGDPDVLDAQVRRMLADPKADALVENFASQWLFLGDVDLKEPDPLLFRHFDDTLREAFRRETELFVSSIFREDRSVRELLDADYTFLNERLAAHYEIPGVRGSHFRRVTLPPDSHRGGLLGQGSILMLTSYSTRTSPVLRGKYVLDNLLAAPPPPPPPDVPALTTGSGDSGGTLTIREAMVRHRENPACALCHASMDPIGVALENFDAIGRWRDTEGGAAVDASGVFPDGTSFEGVSGLEAVLSSRPENFVRALTERLMMFAIGRNVRYYDAPAVRAIVREAAGEDYRFESLVLGVVRSVPFRMRMAGD